MPGTQRTEPFPKWPRIQQGSAKRLLCEQSIRAVSDSPPAFFGLGPLFQAAFPLIERLRLWRCLTHPVV